MTGPRKHRHIVKLEDERLALGQVVGSHLSLMPSGDHSPDVRFDIQTHGPQSRLERRLWKNNNPAYLLTLHVGCASLFRSHPPFSAAHVCYAHR